MHGASNGAAQQACNDSTDPARDIQVDGLINAIPLIYHVFFECYVYDVILRSEIIYRLMAAVRKESLVDVLAS